MSLHLTHGEQNDEALALECAALIREHRGLIDAIKHVRQVKKIPFKEAVEWVKALGIQPQPLSDGSATFERFVVPAGTAAQISRLRAALVRAREFVAPYEGTRRPFVIALLAEIDEALKS
jgi:hypothetical protein